MRKKDYFIGAGCPHCVSFQQNQLGERREEVLAELPRQQHG